MMMLNLSVEDVMKCRIIDSVAPRTIYIVPGAILSMAELANIFYQPFTSKFEPSRMHYVDWEREK